MYLGIDIGGTKTLVATFSESGELGQKIRFETPAEYSDFVAMLKSELQQVDLTNLDYVVAGAPGKIDRSSGVGVRFGNLGWENVPLLDDIAKLTNAPVSVENDANLAGLYEANTVLEKHKNVIYITISTGIGGSNIRNGVLDAFTLDSEPGHIMFEHEGSLQKWESFASGKAIFKKYGKPASEISDPADWESIVDNISLGLLSIITLMTPDAIVLGGGVGGHFDKFGTLLKSQLEARASKMATIPALLPASKPDECVIYGCYTLARQKHAGN